MKEQFLDKEGLLKRLDEREQILKKMKQSIPAPEDVLTNLSDACEGALNMKSAERVCYYSRPTSFNLISQILSNGAETDFAIRVRAVLAKAEKFLETMISYENDPENLEKLEHFLENVKRRVKGISILSKNEPIPVRLEKLSRFHG